MFRAVIELLFFIAFVLIGRAVLNSILRGIARSASNSFSRSAGDRPAQQQQQQQPPGVTGELHKDPVCGTYVAESSALKRQVGRETFYYCSESCREKHSLVAR
jgi:YHS domain-containing protein